MKSRLNKNRRKQARKERDEAKRRARHTEKPVQNLKTEHYDHRPNRTIPSEGES